MYNIFLQSIKLITKQKLWQRKKCLGMSEVSKVCLAGGWSFVYPLDPEVGGSGPASQKLPGRWTSWPVLQIGCIFWLSHRRNSSSVKSRTEASLSFAGARMLPVQPGVSLRVEWPSTPGVAHVSRKGARAACQAKNRTRHTAFSSLICRISGWLGWGRIKMWFSCCWELGQPWKGRAGWESGWSWGGQTFQGVTWMLILPLPFLLCLCRSLSFLPPSLSFSFVRLAKTSRFAHCSIFFFIFVFPAEPNTASGFPTPCIGWKQTATN